MMLPPNVNRSTMAAQSLGSVKVLVQPPEEAPDSWYSYPLVGTNASLKVTLAQSVGGQEVSVSVTGAETPELRLRTDTLLSAFASV
jgi:hypothetical protein